MIVNKPCQLYTWDMIVVHLVIPHAITFNDKAETVWHFGRSDQIIPVHVSQAKEDHLIGLASTSMCKLMFKFC